jgi:hypothetical protein
MLHGASACGVVVCFGALKSELAFQWTEEEPSHAVNLGARIDRG